MSGINDDDERQATAHWFQSLQDRLCAAFEEIERDAPGPFANESAQPGVFERKTWDRVEADGAPGGGGRSALLRGRVFEKAGIHSSIVHGRFAPEFAKQIQGASDNPQFWAAGVSLIAHPWNPNVPTVHFNTRHVVTSKSWFGGGADLTPVLDRRRTAEDVDSQSFHETLRAACERHAGVASYPRFKSWCDEYFFLKHRNEPRGIGGIFFDYLEPREDDADRFDACFSFVRDLGETFLALYPEIVRGDWTRAWTEEDRQEQLVRRARYVEFNLIYDRGTLFGLKTGGNVDSILSSMPPLAAWP